VSEDTETPVETTEVQPEPVNEYQEKYERLAPLERYVEALGGADKLVELATTGYRLGNDPQFVDELKRLWTPATPIEAKEPEDEFYDPEVKTLSSRVTPELEALNQRNAMLEAKVTELESVRYRETVSTRMESVLKNFEQDPALLKEATETLNKAIGNATPQQLAALNQPGGENTLEMMLVQQYKKLALAPRKTVEAEAPPVSPKATDPKHVTRAALPANTVNVPAGKHTNATVQRILEDVTRKVTGKDPAVFWQ
jgi:hypothetical protein